MAKSSCLKKTEQEACFSRNHHCQCKKLLIEKTKLVYLQGQLSRHRRSRQSTIPLELGSEDQVPMSKDVIALVKVFGHL